MAACRRFIALAAHALWLCACDHAVPQQSSESARADAAPMAPVTAGASAAATAGTGRLASAGSLSSAAGAAAGSGESAPSATAGAAGSGESMPATGANDDAGSQVVDPAQWQPYPQVSYPAENPYSAEKALLGKALYWDEQLSSDDSVACGTCHRPAAGGSDPRPAAPGYLGHPGPDKMRGTGDDPHASPGIRSCREAADGTLTLLTDPVFGDGPRMLTRRAMTSLDAMFAPSMFWDARVGESFVDPLSGAMLIATGGALEAQAVNPIVHPSEMACEGRTWQSVTQKLERALPLAMASQLPPDLQEAQSRAATYPPLFERAFGDSAITPARIAMALATYERTLTANQTPWDRWQAGDTQAMNDQQKRGFGVMVVKGLCICCHTPPLFAGTQLFDDGFHEHSFDGGAAQIGRMPGDYENPQFRTVSIRNASLREPAGLLHDGLAPGNRLEDLIAAYNKEPVHSVSVCRRSLGLTADEQTDLAAFIRNALTDPRAANETAPFDRPKLASEH